MEKNTLRTYHKMKEIKMNDSGYKVHHHHHCLRRQESHRCLQEEITGKSKADEQRKTVLKSNLSPAHFLRLKAAWRKAFKTMTFGHDDSDFETNKKEIRSLHDKNLSLNPDVLDDRKEAAKCNERLSLCERTSRVWVEI